MNSRDLVPLIHVIGFVTGIALYGMLGFMSWSSARETRVSVVGRIPILAAVLGLIWNAGALLVFGWHDFGLGDLSPWLTTISYAALGFLPAVVVDSATRSPQASNRPSPTAALAYALSAAGAAMQAVATSRGEGISTSGLLVLTLGYGAILLWLGVTSRRRSGSQRALTAVALAAFAVSALHLSHHSSDSSWATELIGHHASLPLVLVILYQDYRFALADLFLKRALAALILVVVVVATYATLAPPSESHSEASRGIEMPAALLSAWIVSALLYPAFRGAVGRFVDRVILRRDDYRALQNALAGQLRSSLSEESAVDLVTRRLGISLGAANATWRLSDRAERHRHAGSFVVLDGVFGVSMTIPTADVPEFIVSLSALSKGRRLLSDDVALLDAVALLTARRIDELRIGRERLARDVRESEMQRLAAVAELSALRAQLNPHFLFNALTTIGYLIGTSPARAIDTLYQLTALLRAVLRRSAGDFVTFGEELHIVDAYLAIEQARFENRLRVERFIPTGALDVLIPPLIVQPIVENAIKHGVASRRAGAVVRIHASLERVDGPEPNMRLRVTVSDTGMGVDPDELERRRATGVGLANIERRLHRYFGASAMLAIDSVPGSGTTVEVLLPTSRTPGGLESIRDASDVHLHVDDSALPVVAAS